MSILINRDFPIINGFVQTPGNHENGRNYLAVEDALDLYPGSEIVTLPKTGYKSHTQRFLRLPALETGCCPVLDPDPQVELAAPTPPAPSYPA